MKLLLDEMTLRFVWGSSGEYWYSRIDSQIHSSAELECADTEDLMANGFIPFLTISNEEVIRAYIKFIGLKLFCYLHFKCGSYCKYIITVFKKSVIKTAAVPGSVM